MNHLTISNASVSRNQPQQRILATCKNVRPWDMEKFMILLSELIKRNLLLVMDDVYKLKESIIIDATEAEIEV